MRRSAPYSPCQENVRSPGTFSFTGSATGLGLADFMVGSVNEFRQANPFTLDITQKYVGVYLQDTWQVSPNLTFNGGLRWEPWFPQEHRQRQIYSFELTRYQAGERSAVFPSAPPGLRYPGDEGFPGLQARFVLVAAAANRPDGAAVGEDEHLRPGALRRRSVRAHDGDERDGLAARQGVRSGRQDVFVQISTSTLDFCFSCAMNASAVCCCFCCVRNCLMLTLTSSSGSVPAA